MSKILLIGSMNNLDSKIKKFLNEFSKESFDNPKSWEKKIFNFFNSEAFVFYVGTIQKTEEELDIMQQELSSYYMSFLENGVIHLNTNEMFKTLIEINEFLKHGGDISNYYRALFIYNFIIRQMFTKVVDKNDETFKKFSTVMSFKSWILGKNENELNQRVWVVCADNTIKYPFEKYFDIVDGIVFQQIQKEIKKGDKAPSRKRDPIESRLRHEVFKRDNYICKECGKTKENTTLHADHIIPVSQGGCDELDNLQTLCQACNLAKSNRKWKAGEIKKEVYDEHTE